MKLKKGDKVWVMAPRFKRAGIPPKPAKIIVLSKTVGKQIGVEFDEPGIGVHNCDGFGSSNNCLFVAPQHLMNKKKADAYAQQMKREAKELEALTIEAVDELELDV
jgi:hypothetical protein